MTNYIPINSVLYDIADLIDDKFFNEASVKEWLAKGYRQINIDAKYSDEVVAIDIKDHKGKLPKDFKYLIQMAYTIDDGKCFFPLKLSTNPYHKSICLNTQLTTCKNCAHSITISPDLQITSTLKEGKVLVAYKGYPMDQNGDFLMPDDESLKEALLNFVLYRYWLKKYTMKEEGADQRMNHHLQMWQTLSIRSQSLNLPDVSTLENIKNIWNRMVPRENEFSQFFISMADNENIKY